MIKKYLKTISLLFLYLSVILMGLTMFFSFNSSSHLSVICLYCSGVSGFLQHDFKNINFTKDYKLIFLTSFFLLSLYLTTYLLNSNSSEFNEFEKRINIFVIPIIIYFIPIEKKIFKSIVLIFIITVFFRDILAFCNIVIEKGLNYDFSNGSAIHSLLLGERPYIGATAVLSGALCLHLFYSKKDKLKWFFLIISILQFAFISYISAKIAFLSFIIISLIITYWNIFIIQKKIKQSIVIFLVLLGASILSFLLSTNLQKRFEQSLGKDERTFIYKTTFYCLNKVHHSVLFGYFSENEAQKSLKEEYTKELQKALYMPHRRWEILKYLKKANDNYPFDYKTIINKKYDEDEGKFWYSYFNNFNTHNQFLNLYLSYGLLGLITLILYVSSFYYIGISKKNPILIIITLCMTLFMITENILSKEQSVVLYVSLFNIFLKLKNKESEE